MIYSFLSLLARIRIRIFFGSGSSNLSGSGPGKNIGIRADPDPKPCHRFIVLSLQVASVLRPIENRVGAPPQPAAAAAATSPATLTALKRPAPSNNSGEPMEVDGEDGLIGLPEKKNRVEINVVDETGT